MIPYDLHYKRYCSFFDRPFQRSHFPPAQNILYRSRFSRCRMTKLNYLIISVFTGHLDYSMAPSGNQLKASSFSKRISSKFRPELYLYIYSGRLVTTNSGPKMRSLVGSASYRRKRFDCSDKIVYLTIALIKNFIGENFLFRIIFIDRSDCDV